MGIFGFGKKKNEENESCGCDCSCGGGCCCESEESEVVAEYGVVVLGSGCAKCNQLEESAAQAMKELGIDEQIYHENDFAKIAEYGVMSTPALVIDGKVVSSGRVLSKDEVIDILKKERC